MKLRYFSVYPSVYSFICMQYVLFYYLDEVTNESQGHMTFYAKHTLGMIKILLWQLYYGFYDYKMLDSVYFRNFCL